MTDKQFPLKRGDVEIIRKVRATNGGGCNPHLTMSKAALCRLIACGAVRYKPVNMAGNLSTPDHVWLSKSAQCGMIIHGPNADAILRATEIEQ